MARVSRRIIAKVVAQQLTDAKTKSTVVQQLAAYLVENNRVREAELIVRDIETELATRGTVVATVWSARTITKELTAAVEAMVAKEFTGADSIQIREEIDSSLLAGIKLAVPGKQVDLSARHKLDKLSVS